MNTSTSTINRTYVFGITLVATLGGLLFGYDTAVISGSVGSLEKFFIEPFGLSETVANTRLGFVVSSALIGCVIGGMTGGIISLKLGRKKGLMLAALLFIISDFVGDIDLKLLSKKHDVFAVMVRDRFEEDPSELGYLRLIDMETKQSFEGNIDSGTLKSYKKALHDNDENLYKQFKKQGIRFTKIYTHEEPALKLMKTMR